MCFVVVYELVSDSINNIHFLHISNNIATMRFWIYFFVDFNCGLKSVCFSLVVNTAEHSDDISTIKFHVYRRAGSRSPLPEHDRLELFESDAQGNQERFLAKIDMADAANSRRWLSFKIPRSNWNNILNGENGAGVAAASNTSQAHSFNNSSHSGTRKYLKLKCNECEDARAFMQNTLHPAYLDITPRAVVRTRERKSVINCQPGRDMCCLVELTINFAELGYDWILQPTNYTANYCAGSCRGTHFTYTIYCRRNSNK